MQSMQQLELQAAEAIKALHRGRIGFGVAKAAPPRVVPQTRARVVDAVERAVRGLTPSWPRRLPGCAVRGRAASRWTWSACGAAAAPMSTIPINDALLAALRALPSRGRSEWVFPNADNTVPLDGREFDRLVFRPALKRAGIRDFRWKDLRHTFATRLRMQAGEDLATIRDLLGHTTSRMTERYAHATAAHHLAAVQHLCRTPKPANEVAPVVAPGVADVSSGDAPNRVSTGAGK